MTRRAQRLSSWTVGRIARVLGLLAGVLVLVTLAGPGITIDEPLDVRPGRNYVATLRATGFGFFRHEVVDRVFDDNKEHPPLGRWLLGIASTLGEPFEVLLLGGPDPVGIYVVSGRTAPAIVFALLVTFIASESGRRFGPPAAWASGFGLIVMPRVFAHAHLAALDLFIAAAWSVALLLADRALHAMQPVRGMAIAGFFWGLALLVKIHAWLLPPLILACAVRKLGWQRGLMAFAIWSAIGLGIFLAGWPWLWFDPAGRFRGYLATGVNRVPILVEYFKQTYRDVDVPWHYPWLYFAATVPIGLHGLGIVGLVRAIRTRDDRSLLLVATIGAILALFSTNLPVYDGERLFLLVFPLWAILIGQGFAWLWQRAASQLVGRAILVTILLAQSIGLITIHPFGLSYYNLLVGGLPGAERLGLELEYWSEAVDRTLLDRLAQVAGRDASACLAPTLAQEQGKIVTSRNLVRQGIVLGDESETEKADWLVLYRRSTYWKEPVRRFLDDGEVVFSRSRQGVWLAEIVHRRKGKTPPVHRAANP